MTMDIPRFIGKNRKKSKYIENLPIAKPVRLSIMAQFYVSDAITPVASIEMFRIFDNKTLLNFSQLVDSIRVMQGYLILQHRNIRLESWYTINRIDPFKILETGELNLT